MISKRVSRNSAGEPVLVVTVVGNHDVYRFAEAMTTLQCEFAKQGRLALASLRRQLGTKGMHWLDRYFYDGRKRHTRDGHLIADNAPPIWATPPTTEESL